MTSTPVVLMKEYSTPKRPGSPVPTCAVGLQAPNSPPDWAIPAKNIVADEKGVKAVRAKRGRSFILFSFLHVRYGFMIPGAKLR